jgi:hypothetical protein
LKDQGSGTTPTPRRHGLDLPPLGTRSPDKWQDWKPYKRRPPAPERTWWYLSFGDESGFLGGCIVPGENIAVAAQVAHGRGCNPGGEVLGMPLPPGELDKVPEEARGMLLNEAMIEEFFGPVEKVTS